MYGIKRDDNMLNNSIGSLALFINFFLDDAKTFLCDINMKVTLSILCFEKNKNKKKKVLSNKACQLTSNS